MLKSEKQALARFLTLYGLSMALFIGVVASIWYHLQREGVSERHFELLKSYKQELLQELRTTHAGGGLGVELPQTPKYPLAVYDPDGTLLAGDGTVLMPTTQFGWHELDGVGYFISRFPPKYHEEATLVLQDRTLHSEYATISWHIAIFVLLSLLFAGFISLFLARLFLRPMKENIERLDRFIKDATHEMNTPLSSILMSLETLDSSTLPEQVAKKLTRIQNGAKTLSHLYDDLVFANFPEKFPLQHLPCDLQHLLGERIEFFRPIAAQKQLVWECTLEPCVIESDPHRLARIIDNLLSNAIKYNRPGGLLKITLQPNTLTLINEGQTIPPEKEQQLFERYARLSEDQGGFGIGLETVARLCGALHLSITLKSESGKTIATLRWHPMQSSAGSAVVSSERG